MINIEEAKIDAWTAISELFGVDYFRDNFEDSCQSYQDTDERIFEYFLGFEGKGDLWTVYARVEVDRETEEVRFLDYKTPEGTRMINPVKPITYAD